MEVVPATAGGGGIVRNLWMNIINPLNNLIMLFHFIANNQSLLEKKKKFHKLLY
ncbi:hypothetical protein LguiA_033797 [Lonicera macranthoides]